MTRRDLFRALNLAATTAVLAATTACGGATRTSGSTSGDGGGDGSGGGSSDGGSSGGGSSGGGSSGGHVATGGASSAGGAHTSLSVVDFDQSCDGPGTCYPVHDGNQCDCNECPTAAINANEAGRWEAAASQIGCFNNDCKPSPCQPRVYSCEKNRCVVRDPPKITPDDYDRTCRENHDCTVIPIRQLCGNTCDCSSLGSVSYTGYLQLIEVSKNLSCTNQEPDCTCNLPSPDSAICVFSPGNGAGQCQLSESFVPTTPGTMYARDYDQRCEKDDECQVVNEGQQCCMHCPEYAAVSMGAFSTWQSDFSQLRCPGSRDFQCEDPSGMLPYCPNDEPTAVCTNGWCDVKLVRLPN